MYCPQCATPHKEGSKFCRSCGTELEAVALALSGGTAKAAEAGEKKSESKTAEDWLEKHIEGVKGISGGATLMAVSLLIGVALALFVPADVPWMLVWMVFFGWLAVWGGIELASGIGGVLEAKSRLRLMGPAGRRAAGEAAPRQLSSPGEPVTLTNASAFTSSPPLSVTEETTRQLDDWVEK
jgi:zinc-ribbon domain